ncbi:hypothetical protein [Flavobacterium okayamense]|uniref:Secreted protein n=1 Tax=Flavobacterium okayamense TaxID=2830782 RepID=A0ABM7S5I0_9FLAO|nr:hypothetical protein [Flavobacterium okayamense]BCY28756.1 hypothetical protein KK2020170_16240 [Flavobacterium okayamense]
MKIFTNIFFLFFIVSSIAQIDKKNVPLKLKLDNPFKETPADQSNLPSLEFKSIFDTENKPNRYSILPKTEEKTKSILDTSTDFKNPGDEIKNKLNNEIEKEGNWNDVFFGKFIVKTSSIKIKTRDFADPDGDRIRFFLNKDVMYLNELLEANFKTYVLNLKEGDNAIDIMALNQGLAGPNTAFFAIYDENDNLITSNEWNLKTGVSAKFLIEYRKPMR